MNQKIKNTISELQSAWTQLDMPNICKIKSKLVSLAKAPDTRALLEKEALNSIKGKELHHDQNNGFVLLAYNEAQDTYRPPHDHGDAWVIYVVISGEVEMGSYFKATYTHGNDHLIQKEREILGAGDVRIYYPGEIHDTKCISKNAVIMRLTSLDLNKEDRAGRMHRYPDMRRS